MLQADSSQRILTYVTFYAEDLGLSSVIIF